MKNNKYRKPTPKMHYDKDGNELGYIWQTAPGFDPFAAWREGWKKKPKSKAKKKPVPEPQPRKYDPYGYGEGRYMGD